MFDKMLLLSQGRDMYHGDVGQSVEYFAGCNYACPENFNPADYFLDILSPDARNAELEDESQKRIDRLATLWHEQASKHLVALNGAKVCESWDVVLEIWLYLCSMVAIVPIDCCITKSSSSSSIPYNNTYILRKHHTNNNP